ncbi:putative methanol oxidase [Auricularia subglabra TFB-10046 SS5]|nr:putative methanol oxidase [Auricularia subglabra TFB-10046 SS5]
MAAFPEPEADIIVVGAGAAGCVLTARLAAADPTLKILVLEGGPHTLNNPDVLTPGVSTKNLLPNMPRTRYFTSEPSEHLLGRQTVVPAGGCVGGGTAINFMMYARPAASDLDDWERVYGNSGWGFAALRPLFQKLETYETSAKDKDGHGFAGPMHASRGRMNEMSRQWLASALAWDKARPRGAEDYNDFKTADAYGRTLIRMVARLRWISGNGVRQDAGHRFLYPAVHAPDSNVTLRVLCKVNKLVFDGDRAVGVEYFEHTAGTAAVARIAIASKMVVLSAGTFGSPMILERSGIGAPDVLSNADIHIKVPLEGVGENYQDHNLMAAMYAVESGVTDDRDALFRGDPTIAEAVAKEYNCTGGGPLGTNGIDVGAKLRPSEERLSSNVKSAKETTSEAEITALGEAFGAQWQQHFERTPDKPACALAAITGSLIPGIPAGDFVTSAALTTYPTARGSVHCRSANCDDPPRFVPGYLSSQADVALLMWQYKITREIVRRMPCYRGEFVPAHPAFLPGSKAACAFAPGPVPLDEPDMMYSSEDDAALETWVRQTVSTTWHSMGTCAMKPEDQRGVVDPRLNVYGVKALKIADLSIAPANVSANTAATAMTIGEKAAILIGEDLGISGI